VAKAIEQEIQQLADVHALLVGQILEGGHLPKTGWIASMLQISAEELTHRLVQLADMHGLVLHPHAVEPWIVHPFSTTPTLHYVESKHHGWWAPCIWCALGIAQLAGGKIRISTRIGAETEAILLEVEDGVPLSTEEVVIHFSIPPREAWNNVHHHCSLVLPFRNHADVGRWCREHGHAFGEVVSLEATANLAGRWYGPYAKRSWRKWTVEEAQQIFHESGLTSPFWELPGKGTY
jgi:hypothetical protein